MDIRFLAPELRRLDEASVELCACSIWSDVRPVRGLAGLLDWRLGGRLSALLASGFVTGEAGEALLLPGRPHVPMEKLLVVGLGMRSSFAEGVFRETLQRIVRTLGGLRVRRAVVELPGRPEGLIDPERGISLMLECLGPSPERLPDVWWLVEDVAGARRAEERVRTIHRSPSVSDR